MSLEILALPADPGSRHRVVALKGQLETGTVAQFDSYVKAEAPAPPHVWILDLKETSYVSSAGLAALMSLRHQLEEKRGRVCLAGPSEKVMKVFKLLGLIKLFSFYGDVEAALDAGG